MKPTRVYNKTKFRKGNKSHIQHTKAAFERILRKHVKEMNKSLNDKYGWDKVVCGISIGLPSRLNNKGTFKFKKIFRFNVLF